MASQYGPFGDWTTFDHLKYQTSPVFRFPLYLNGKVTEKRLVTKLLALVANGMVQPIQLATI